MEEICYQHLKTPTAAAEYLVRHFEEGRVYLDYLTLQMTKRLEASVERVSYKYQTYATNISERAHKYFAYHEVFASRVKPLCFRV